MSSNANFNWYCFYEVGCELLEKEGEKYWRSAIGRFYYAAFCEARDFLISNNIFYNEDLKDDLTSGKSVVHGATRDIFKYAPEVNFHNEGKNISNKLFELRDYRNFADYDDQQRNFNFYANRAKADVDVVFRNLEKLSQVV